MELPFNNNERINQLEVLLENLFTLYREQKENYAKDHERLDLLEEENRQLREYIVRMKKDEFVQIITDLYQLRRVNLYRSFFSNDYFMGSIQQALGYWAFATSQPSAGAELVNRFVMLFGSRLNNDITILKGNLENYTASSEEKLKLEIELAFPEAHLPDLKSIDCMVGEKRLTLEIEKKDPNNRLYNDLWEHIEPLLAGVEADGLESLLTEEVDSAKTQISRLLSGVQRVFEEQGVLVCYSPDNLPKELLSEADNLFMQADAPNKQRPLIMRLRDRYIYTRGFNYQTHE